MMDVLSDFQTLAVPILAFAGLVVLAGLVLWLGRRARRRRNHGLVAGHRLAVIDQVQIDEHRRLVLIQRDEVQHLVVLGGGSDFLVESGIGEVRAHDAAPQHATVRVAEPPHAPEATRPPDHVPPAGGFRAPEPTREPARASRDVPPPPPMAAPRPPRPIPLPPEARAPVEPRPNTYSRGPAREVATEPPHLAPGPASSPPIRRATDFRVADPELAVRPAPVAYRAEPVIEPPAEPEAGARVTVKVDPLFADMAGQLEETLRRPATPEAEVARRAAVAHQPSGAPHGFERPPERAPERPAPPMPRGPEARKAEEPRIAPVSPVSSPAIPSPTAPAVPAPHSPVVYPPAMTPPAPRAVVRDSELPEPRLPGVLAIRAESRQSETRPADVPAPESPALEILAPENRAPEIRAPEVRATDTRAAEAPVPQIDLAEPRASDPGEPGDLFEEEMANLLGRSRRP